MILVEFLAHWLDGRRGLRPRTIEMYQQLIKYVDVELLMEDTTPARISAMIDRQLLLGHERTAEQLYIMFCAALPRTITETIERPHHRQKRPIPWSPKEIIAFKRSIRGHPHELEFLLALDCGLRRGEICGLRWGDLDIISGICNVHTQYISLSDGSHIFAPVKSESSNREIPITDDVVQAALGRVGTKSERITTLTPNGLGQAVKRAAQLAHVRYIGVHGLRHTCATQLLRADVPIKIITDLLGHSSIAITASVYAHTDLTMIRAAMVKASDVCYNILT